MEGEENGSSPGEPELRLRRCLDARTRRWAAAEFFCCAVDRPWLMQNELEVFHSSLIQRCFCTSTIGIQSLLLINSQDEMVLAQELP